MLDEAVRRKVVARLRRVEGQVAALQRMLDEDEYCVDVLIQISAAQGALGKVGEIVLGSHIETCVSEAFERGGENERLEKIEELMDVFSRYSRIGAR